jgi:hypothetical protein
MTAMGAEFGPPKSNRFDGGDMWCPPPIITPTQDGYHTHKYGTLSAMLCGLMGDGNAIVGY